MVDKSETFLIGHIWKNISLMKINNVQLMVREVFFLKITCLHQVPLNAISWYHQITGLRSILLQVKFHTTLHWGIFYLTYKHNENLITEK